MCGHTPDQIQCCKLGACDRLLSQHDAPPLVLVQTSPKLAVLKCGLLLRNQCRWLLGREMSSLCPGHITLVVSVLCCFPGRVNVSLSPEREQVANIVLFLLFFFFHTVRSLRVTLSPHFLSFFLRLSLSLSLCGVAWFFSQHGEA